jgi:hypothetical protein
LRSSEEHGLRSTVAFLSLEKRRVWLAPQHFSDRKAGVTSGLAHQRIVINENADLLSLGQAVEDTEFELPGWAAVVIWAKENPSARNAMCGQPRLSDVTGSFGAPTHVNDVMSIGQLLSQREPLRKQRVVAHSGEEASPILRPCLEVMKPVANIGEHAINIDNGNRPVHFSPGMT